MYPHTLELGAIRSLAGKKRREGSYGKALELQAVTKGRKEEVQLILASCFPISIVIDGSQGMQ